MNDGLFQDPGVAAPHVEKAWRDAFLVELRLLEVDGERMGDALMTVESHVRDSGEEAAEAFGDPREYARELAARSGPVVPRMNAAFAGGNLLGLIGLLLTTSAVDGWFTGGAVLVRLGNVVAFTLILVMAGALFARLDRFIRLAVDHAGWVIVAGTVGVGLAVIVPTLLLRQPLGAFSAVPLGLVGVALVAVGSIIGYRTAGDDDDIVIPGQRVRGGGRSVRLIAAATMPGALAIALLLGAIPRAFG